MYLMIFILISTAIYSNAIPLKENSPTEFQNIQKSSYETKLQQVPKSVFETKFQQIPKSFNEAMFSDKYIRDAPELYKNEPYSCPNLTRPDCDVKTTTNTMMQPCNVCVARERESCDPYLDPCESG